MKANPTRQQLIDMVRNPETPHVPAWAREIADQIEAAKTEREASILTERLAGALGYESDD